MFFFTQFVRLFLSNHAFCLTMHFVFICICAAIFLYIYLSARSSTASFFHSFDFFIRCRSHPRVVNFRPSHRFQFGFSRVTFPLYYSASLQLFGLFLSIVIQRSLVFKLTFFLSQKYYISFQKKKL